MMKTIPALCLLMPLLCASCGKNEKPDADSGSKRNSDKASGEFFYDKAKDLAKKVHAGAEDAVGQTLEWTRKAAEQGHREAQMTLAGLYYYGRNELPRDSTKAREWFEKAAAQGVVEARYFLGLLHAQGDGVKQDFDEALRQWSIAAQGGIADAQYQLGLFYIQGSETFEQGIYWLKQAAGQAFSEASMALGKIYANGMGNIRPDMQEAAKWYKQAAESNTNNKQGQYVYALMCLNGSGIPQDPRQGFYWLKLAAGQDYLPAIKKLVACYREGIGTPKDDAQAQAWEQRLHELQAKERP